MSRRENEDITIREGTSEKNWYPIAAFVFLTLGAALLTAIMLYQRNYTPSTVGYIAGGLILILLLISFGSHVSLFRDSAYVRGAGFRWKPKWWLYIGVPVAVGVATYLVGSSTSTTNSIGISIITYFFITFVAHSYYLYQRHNQVGVP